MPCSALDDVQLRVVAPSDPLLAPLLDDLARDYTARYPEIDIPGEMTAYPDEAFSSPSGAFLVLLRDGALVAGGAYMRHDDTTAELKRVWTSSSARRQGLGQRVVGALEEHARAAGYRSLFLTTGPRQPEARALYLRLGYAPVGDHDAIVAAASGPLPFVKDLG